MEITNEIKDRIVSFLEKKDLTDSDRLLVKLSIEGINKRYPDTWDEAKSDRLGYELNIIIKMGFSDYFLIVQDFLNFGRKIGYMPKDRMEYLNEHASKMSVSEMLDYIEADQSYPGLTIGPGRGSAAGSLAAYLLGITDIEPLENGLLFERFLNPERISMPDIDSDLSKSEDSGHPVPYGVRNTVIEYVSKKYGRGGVVGICTPSTEAARGAIEDIARIYGSKQYMEDVEAGRIQENKANEQMYKKNALKMNDTIKRFIPADPGVKLSDYEDIFMEGIRGMQNHDDMVNIFQMAKKIEGVNVNYGRHACGVIISDNGDVAEYAPLMMDDNGWKIQMDAGVAEERGFLKMDFLGLMNLNIITMTLRRVYENRGVFIDALNLPQEKEVYSQIFSKGLTNAVFQFESEGMKKMLKSFKPDCFSDIVLLVACYRPGPMQYLDGIIDRKHGGEVDKNSALYKIKECHDIVAPTYDAIVYQEQVQQIFRKLAGYTMGQADHIRKAMGKKKTAILDAEEEIFIYGDPSQNIVGCKANGIDPDAARQLYAEMREFGKYAFNKSHAAAYAQTAYITAYLKYHYPVEFYASVMNFVASDKYQKMINESKQFGVEFKVPNINVSQSDFTNSGDTIYFGLSGIKGVGSAVAKQIQGKYSSIADFALKTQSGNGLMEKLIDSGAFDGFCKNRAAIKAVLPDYMREIKTIKDQQKKIDIAGQMLKDLENGGISREKYNIKTKSLPDKKKLEARIEAATQAVKEAEDSTRDIIIPVQMPESIAEKLDTEKELLGMYVSGHPINEFGKAQDFEAKPVSEVSDAKKLFGIITDYRTVSRKSDGKPMAFFKLQDQTGEVDVCCFTKQYAKFQEKLSEGRVIVVTGNPQLIDENDEDAGYQFILNDVKPVVKKQPDIRIFVPDISKLSKYVEMARKHSDPKGSSVKFIDEETGQLYKLSFKVGPSIRKEEINII